MARVLANRFELGERVGKGSLSVVHDAIDRETGRRVAIKLAAGREDKDSVRQRFDREAAALSVIQSAHVVELIWAATDEDGMPFLVLEKLIGKNLQEVIGERGPFKPERVGRYMAQAATALELAHGLGIVHRDLKPANLFLHDTGEDRRILKVLDFGLVVDTGGPTERMRDAFGGTPLYMAPEQARGQLTRIGPATDIYAIAHVTLTLLTGETYWTDGLAEDVMREIEAGVSTKPSQRWPWLTDAFDQWFMRSTQRVPERRYKSVVEQAARLVEALRGLKAPDQRTPAPSLVAASTIAARTPTPSIVRLAGHRTPVIGRGIEYRDIDQLLARGKVVTLTGAAGVGKTRLAQAICETAGERFIDGTWFVRLVAGSSGDDGDGAKPVLGAIASTLSIEPDATRSLFDNVVDNLAMRRVLIVLDGVDRVAGSSAIIDELVRRCPAVTWLATSHAPLGLASEHKYVVEALDVPPAENVALDEAETYAGVALFVACAREVTPMFAITDDNVADIVAICRAVGGSPLAIEIAAAQVSSAKPAQIRAGLERGGAHAGSTVRHAIMSSYALLSPDQQRVLRQLAILPAGLTFEQVKLELAHLSDDPMYAVLRLVQTHLATWSSDTPRRLRMLDTVREIARDLSRQAGEDASLWQFARKHAYAIATSSSQSTTDAWLARVDLEYDNLRAVLGHLLHNAPADAMELAGRLAFYWYLRGSYADGMQWLEAAIARSTGADDERESLARALLGAGRLALLTCHYARAQELLSQARSLSIALGDLPSEANADQLLGSVARELGEYTQAHNFHARSLDIWQRINNAHEIARARNYLAFAAWIGDYAGMPSDELLAWWNDIDEQALRSLADPEITVWYLLNRGAILHHKGDPAARDILGQAFAEAVAARFYEGIAWSLDQIGRVSLERGHLLQARAQLSASLRVHRRLGDRWRCASVLEALASASVASDRPARGAVYLGAADTIREQINAPVPACERPMLASTEARGVDMIGQAFDAGRERGHRTTLDQTIELSRDVV
ncbi:MAG TPA: protein kinase [Kofleriaceae bacterium]|nr:protein kinase [Kofleriaceae bacterium]